MAFFRARIGDKTYEIDKLTLGDARLLKRKFDLADLDEFSPTDPDQLVGLLVLALKRERPAAEFDQLVSEVEALDIEDFQVESDDEAPAEDPTPAPASDVAPSASEVGA